MGGLGRCCRWVGRGKLTEGLLDCKSGDLEGFFCAICLGFCVGKLWWISREPTVVSLVPRFVFFGGLCWWVRRGSLLSTLGRAECRHRANILSWRGCLGGAGASWNITRRSTLWENRPH